MSKDIVEKKSADIFEHMRCMHKDIWNQMKEMDTWFDNTFKKFNLKPTINIKLNDINSFKESIEQFQKEHPDAKIKASAYVYSTDTNPQMFKYETSEKNPKLKGKKKIKK